MPPPHPNAIPNYHLGRDTAPDLHALADLAIRTGLERRASPTMSHSSSAINKEKKGENNSLSKVATVPASSTSTRRRSTYEGSSEISSNAHAATSRALHTTGIPAASSVGVKQNTKLCDICQQTFRRPSELVMHVNAVHKGLQSFQCVECGKRFSFRASLSKHVRTVHRGERPHTCEACGVRFSERSNLKKHLERHPECAKDA